MLMKTTGDESARRLLCFSGGVVGRQVEIPPAKVLGFLVGFTVRH